ncbi:MAG: ATP-NAD kinase family protein [Pseudomonadota bacterium]|nr:ATP-NAD kinase family protein [Pseudomonadota bacterium]
MNQIKLGLIVNPMAGIGGAVGLKGSDGDAIVDEALNRGAIPRALQRVAIFLNELTAYEAQIHWYCWSGPMGEDSLQEAGFAAQVCGQSPATTGPMDTCEAARALQQEGVDLLVFAGGDGTARDIHRAVGTSIPVLGIPAGVKIHSGVYAVHAKGAAEIISKMIRGELVSVARMEVRDIDEEAFRHGQVRASHFGELLVPAEERYLQHVKCGGKEVEALVLQEMAAHVIDDLEADCVYILGPGTTTRAIAEALGLDKTLLGVDLLLNQQMVQMDVTEQDILPWIERYPARIIVTLIGGQGHIFGRGNHQISPPVIHKVGRDNILIVATKTKLKELDGRPLLVDTWDAELNRALSGYLPVITGYEDAVLYPVEG